MQSSSLEQPLFSCRIVEHVHVAAPALNRPRSLHFQEFGSRTVVELLDTSTEGKIQLRFLVKDGYSQMRQVFLVFVCLSGLCAGSVATGQSTISDQPLELSVGTGIWAALLPAYELGTNASGGSAFQDDLDNVGTISQLKLVRRFLGTRTSFETKGFYANSKSTTLSDVTSIDIPEPVLGTSNVLAGGRPSLRSGVDHYGVDIALRDTWRTRFGGLSAGGSFSFMAFDQDFDLDYGTAQLFREELETKLRGGKAFVGWDGRLRGRQTNIDLTIGFFDMNVDYRFDGQSIPGSLLRTHQEITTTIESSITSRSNLFGYHVAWTLGATYLSDLPTIQHNTGSAVTIGTDDAVTFTGMLEFLM